MDRVAVETNSVATAGSEVETDKVVLAEATSSPEREKVLASSKGVLAATRAKDSDVVAADLSKETVVDNNVVAIAFKG